MPEWTLLPGQRIRRTELHEQFGGSGQNGISPSRSTPNVFIFSDPKSGEQHGYRDVWKEDGCFHYTGDGQRGDQRMMRGNRAILEAETRGYVLRVFKGASDEVEYKGRFVLDAEQPWYMDDAPETNGAQLRSVIIFRLRPLDSPPESPTAPAIQPQTKVTAVPIEEQFTERTIVDPTREPYEAERRESALVQKFKIWMEGKGHILSRWMITPADEAKPIFTDIFVEDMALLVEAKGSIDRSSIRMAIGQLIDYSRFEDKRVKLAVLLPMLPRKDLLRLLYHTGILIYYPLKDGFVLEDGQGARVWV